MDPNIIIKTFRISEVSLSNQIPPEFSATINVQYVRSINKLPDGSYSGEYKLIMRSDDELQALQITLSATALFEYSGELTKQDDINIEASKRMYPELRASFTGILGLIGIGPVSIPFSADQFNPLPSE